MKKATRRSLFSKKLSSLGEAQGLLQALLRKAGASRCTLAGLELRIRFADHVNGSFAFHDLAISVTAFCGGKRGENFHGVRILK